MTSHPIHEDQREGCCSHLASSELPQRDREAGESLLRHYAWGVLIVLMGALTIFGYWFLFAR